MVCKIILLSNTFCNLDNGAKDINNTFMFIPASLASYHVWTMISS